MTDITIEKSLAKVNEAFAEFTTALAKVNVAALAPVDPSNAVVKSGRRSAPVAEADVDEETGQVTLVRDEVEGLPIVELRKLAKSNGIDLKRKSDILDAFEEGGFFAGAVDVEDEDDEDVDLSDDDDEADEDEESEYTRDDLEELDLRELKRIAKEEGNSQADIKGLDQEGLIDLILGEEEADEDEDEEDEEEDDDDEEADDEDDEDEDDDEEVVIDKETLEGMSDAELKNIVKQFSIKLPRAAKRKTIIQTILDAAEDADDDE